jgi:hypothetical protein
MSNPTKWPPKTGSEWHHHFIYCPYCNHRQHGVGCKRNDCVPAVTATREYEGMERVRCIQCGKRFWFNDGCDSEKSFDKVKLEKNLHHFGEVGEYLDAHDFICSFCGTTLLDETVMWDGVWLCQDWWETLYDVGQIMAHCSCGARQLIRIPSGVAKAVRKDGMGEGRG